MNKKQIMKRAWELAKNGAKKFGGKVREYFAAALSIAWKEVKSMVKKTKLIGTPKQNKWAKDIIEKVRKAQPRMKSVCTAICKEEGLEQYLDEALAFIDSLDNFPLFKNQSSMYITYFSKFTRNEDDVYELLDRLFYYDDISATVSKFTREILKATYRRIEKEKLMKGE